MGVLDKPFVRRVRRNHAVEHATIHILSGRHGHMALAGRADSKGFHLYGRVATDELASAVHEALRRLVHEPELAVHPRCGTNLVVSGVVAGCTSLVAMASLPSGRRHHPLLDVLPRLMLAGTAAAVASQSLGPFVQRRYTTHPDVAGVTVEDIRRTERAGAVFHRIRLAGPA